MAEAPKFNLRNPAVKRIMQEIKEIKQDTSGDFLAEALETDIFEWHFVIRGPPDTEFEGGIFHGRILLPAEYPFKPPSFMMLTPNGRFETNMKICLSISSHHPEHWQPSWSVRTALTALIAFMPSPGAGALGALDFPKEERRVLAARSRLEPPRFGSADRQCIIDEMHNRMMSVAAAKEAERRSGTDTGARASGETGDVAKSADAAPADEQPEGLRSTSSSGDVGAASASGRRPSEEAPVASSAGDEGEQAAAESAVAPAISSGPSGGRAIAEVGAGDGGKGSDPWGLDPRPAVTATATSDPNFSKRSVPAQQPSAGARTQAAAVGGSSAAGGAAGGAIGAAPRPLRNAAAGGQAPAAVSHAVQPNGGAAAAGVTTTDHMLTALMWALYVGIGAILLRKVMGVIGFDIAELLQ